MSARTIALALALLALVPGAALADEPLAPVPERETASRTHAEDHENKTVETHHRSSWSWDNVTWRQGATSVAVERREERTDSWGSDTGGDARYDWRESATDRETTVRASAAPVEFSQSVQVANETRRTSHGAPGEGDRSRESTYVLAAPGAAATFGWSLRERADVDQCRVWVVGVTTVTLLDPACLPPPAGLSWPGAAHDAFRRAGHDLLP